MTSDEIKISPIGIAAPRTFVVSSAGNVESRFIRLKYLQKLVVVPPAAEHRTSRDQRPEGVHSTHQ